MNTQTQYNQDFQKYFSNLPRYSEVLITLRFRRRSWALSQKREIKLVFKTAHLWIVLCVFSENVERNLAFLVKTKSYSNHDWWKCWVNLELHVFSKNAEWNKTFFPKTWVKLCISRENAVLVKILLCGGILNLMYIFKKKFCALALSIIE